MYLNFKRWIKGNDEIHAMKLQFVDEKIKKFFSELNEEFSNIDKESIFIYGMLHLLDRLHKNEKRYLDKLRILLETYIIFLREQSNHKDFDLKPLQISAIYDKSEIHLHGIFDSEGGGSPACYNLVESLSNFIEYMINIDRENLLISFSRETRH